MTMKMLISTAIMGKMLKAFTPGFGKCHEWYPGLTLLVIMYITNRSRRFGPILVKNLTCRRQLMEHIKATAHFYHRLDNGHVCTPNFVRQFLIIFRKVFHTFNTRL